MGDIAEMMLDGLMCEGCGEFIDDGEEPGYPRQCEACARGRGEARSFDTDMPMHLQLKIVGCPQCKRRFRTHDAYLQHYRAKHDAAPQETGP